MKTHTETIIWHRLPGQMPDADITVLLSVEGDDPDYCESVGAGYLDGADWRWSESGGIVAAKVIGWAEIPAGLVGVPL